MRGAEEGWAVVVPVKGGPLAKSRLALPRATRSALADAFARDTVDALAAGMPGAPLLVVTGDADVTAWVVAAGHRQVHDLVICFGSWNKSFTNISQSPFKIYSVYNGDLIQNVCIKPV